MVAKTLNEDSLGKITYDDEISLLTLDWLESSRDMIAPHFQGILYLLAGHALQKKSEKIFIDARKFLFHPSDELIGPWRTKNISPYIMRQGLRNSRSFFLQALQFHQQMDKICLMKNFQLSLNVFYSLFSKFMPPFPISIFSAVIAIISSIKTKITQDRPRLF